VAQAPTAVQQVILLVLFVLPGITYQFVRERLRGPVPGERDLSERVLRAITASIALDAVYLLVAGPQIIRVIKPAQQVWFNGLAADPRTAAAVALALFIVFPAAAAWIIGWVQRRSSPARFHVVPTAWDSAFRARSACFVRAKLKSGVWVGGWYGRRSYASAYPHAADLFLQSAYEMHGDGSFGVQVRASAGLYLRMDEVEVLEFVEAATNK
jgi:hypothetical protein